MSLPKVINAREAARQFSDLLNQVKYQGTSFAIARGKQIVARIVPAAPLSGVKVADLTAFFASLPKLNDSELESFENDLKAIRHEAALTERSWD